MPLEPPAQPVDGDSHAHLLEPLTGLAGELGYTVTRAAPRRAQPTAGATREPNGSSSTACCPPTARSGCSSTRSRTRSGSATATTAAAQAEVLVDTVTHIVCGSVGLDISGSSVPYIAGWGEDGELDAIRAYAETIDTVARRIEKRILPTA